MKDPYEGYSHVRIPGLNGEYIDGITSFSFDWSRSSGAGEVPTNLPNVREGMLDEAVRGSIALCRATRALLDAFVEWHGVPVEGSPMYASYVAVLEALK